MAILDIEIVVTETAQLDAGLASSLADAAAEVFGTSPGRTWVRVRRLPLNDYAENGGGPPDGVLPVFVAVLKSKHPPAQLLHQEITALTTAVSQVCGRPEENVHVIYEPEANGRVAFGGRLVIGN